MSDEKTNPDELTKTTDDNIKLTEADLNQVSGGATNAYMIIDGVKGESTQ